MSNILDFGNKINAETRLARWLNVNAGLRCQVYAVTDKVYNFLEQRAAVSFGRYNVYGRKNPMYAEIEESSYGGYGLRLTSVFTAFPTIRYTLFF